MPIDLSPLLAPKLSRRQALGGIALGSLALAAGPGCDRNPGSHGKGFGWYALFSDPHVASNPGEVLRDEVMAENLRKAVDGVLSADDPALGVIVNGDLAFKRGEPGDYRTFGRLVQPLRSEGLPLHATLGNHDHRDNLRLALGDPSSPASKRVGVVEGPGVRFLLLDSQNGVNVTAGHLGDEQLAWLATELDQRPDKPAVVVVHHNINAHSESALLDTEALLSVLRPRIQAKCVVFGHTHVWNVRKIDDLHMINLPALGYRFLKKQPLGWVVYRPEIDGAEIELRCVGGDRRQHGRKVELRWRA